MGSIMSAGERDARREKIEQGHCEGVLDHHRSESSTWPERSLTRITECESGARRHHGHDRAATGARLLLGTIGDLFSNVMR
jgi:hypothetical protein